MELDIIKKQKIWVPPRTWGVCIWVLPDGKALMDADGNALSAEGFVNDPNIASTGLVVMKGMLLGFTAQEKLVNQKEKIK